VAVADRLRNMPDGRPRAPENLATWPVFAAAIYRSIG
jgi:hypothetical protein